MDEEKNIGQSLRSRPAIQKVGTEKGGRGRKRESPSASLVERPLIFCAGSQQSPSSLIPPPPILLGKRRRRGGGEITFVGGRSLEGGGKEGTGWKVGLKGLRQAKRGGGGGGRDRQGKKILGYDRRGRRRQPHAAGRGPSFCLEKRRG